jgi:alpha-beta hydrolase superfamily lysophospholipase
MTYGFDTRLRGNKSNQGLPELAENLRMSLEGMRMTKADSKSSNSGNPKPKMVFIAHSLGGLVLKEVSICSRCLNADLMVAGDELRKDS